MNNVHVITQSYRYSKSKEISRTDPGILCYYVHLHCWLLLETMEPQTVVSNSWKQCPFTVVGSLAFSVTLTPSRWGRNSPPTFPCNIPLKCLDEPCLS